MVSLEEVEKLTENLVNFIPENEIQEYLTQTSTASKEEAFDVIEKAKEKKGLSPRDVAVLLNVDSEEVNEYLFEVAAKIKKEIYGKRIVLFAPLYISNKCVNNCLYCGFRRDNKLIKRKTLTDEEIEKETRALLSMGHKRLIVVYGESPASDAKFISDSIRLIYSIKEPNANIRRVNVNAPPMKVEELKLLKEVGIGTYQVFQETYHRKTYEYVHPKGTIKHNFLWRLYSLDRAMEAGIDDVAIGALFGLYDWKFEVMGLIYHAIHLDKEYGVGPHTISFPRLKKAYNTPFTQNSKYAVNDKDFKKLVAILRLAVPYTGLILTAREPADLRREVLKVGVSQTDAGTRIGLGGYQDYDQEHKPDSEQFEIYDTRSLEEFVYELIKDGYIPSWCTACYRMGRTGEHFMSMAKPGFIQNFCHPNALLTFAEYLEDYAGEETKKAGYELIKKEIENITSSKRKEATLKRLEDIKKGKRDVYF